MRMCLKMVWCQPRVMMMMMMNLLRNKASHRQAGPHLQSHPSVVRGAANYPSIFVLFVGGPHIQVSSHLIDKAGQLVDPIGDNQVVTKLVRNASTVKYVGYSLKMFSV